MTDDHHHDDAETGPWPLGGALALAAGVIGAALVSVVGGGSSLAAGLVGLVSFGVFGALLGAGGVQRGAAFGEDAHHNHGHENGGGHH